MDGKFKLTAAVILAALAGFLICIAFVQTGLFDISWGSADLKEARSHSIWLTERLVKTEDAYVRLLDSLKLISSNCRVPDVPAESNLVIEGAQFAGGATNGIYISQPPKPRRLSK